MTADSLAAVLAMDTEPSPPPEGAICMPTIPPPARVPMDFWLTDPSPTPWTDEGGLEP